MRAKILKSLFTALLLSLLLAFSSGKHPFYLSVTSLKYNPGAERLQGTVKIFTNDLEAALRKTYNRPIDLINGSDSLALRKLLHDYLELHFKLEVNGSRVAYSVPGFEQEEEAVWIYLESGKCEMPGKLRVENTILYEHLPGQMNIVHIEVHDRRQSLKVSNPEKEMVFQF